MVSNIITNHEPIPVVKNLGLFLEGGPLRIFLATFLQILRKLKPAKAPQSRKSSDRSDLLSVEEPKSFQLAIELFRYYMFNEPSELMDRLKIKARRERICDTGEPQVTLFKLMMPQHIGKKVSVYKKVEELMLRCIQVY